MTDMHFCRGCNTAYVPQALVAINEEPFCWTCVQHKWSYKDLFGLLVTSEAQCTELMQVLANVLDHEDFYNNMRAARQRRLKELREDDIVMDLDDVTCPSCDGVGDFRGTPCPECGGEGVSAPVSLGVPTDEQQDSQQAS